MSVEPVDGSAYTMANAFESFEPRNGVYDVTGRVFIGVFPQPEATGAIGPFDHHGCGEPGGASPEEARGFKLWPSYSHALGCQMNNGRPVIACVCGLPNKSSEGIE